MPPKKINKNKPWTDIHQKKFIWLYNWYVKKYDDKASQETFIDQNKRQLMSLIENNKDWSNSSKESLLFMIARYLYNKNNNDRYVKMYSEKGFNYMIQKDKIESENQMDGKEIKNYRTIEYLNNFLEIYKTKASEDITEHYKYLLLFMLIKQPPLRTSFYSSAKFLRLLTENNKKDNYVYINKRGSLKIYYIVNRDKASNYKIYNMNKDLSKIKLENEELMNYINYSFNTYPREYVFENPLTEKPLSDSTLLKYLRDITKTPLINFDMIRSAYITNYYENNKTFGKRDELSKQMRHSQGTASKNYLKVSDSQPIAPEEQLTNLNKTIIQLKNNVDECHNKLNVFQSNTDDEKKFNKKKKDILYLLNKGKKSKLVTIKKYGILYDEKTKLYY
jgi:hypothetical protein